MGDVSDMVDVRLSVRLKPDLAAALLGRAKFERRSVSDMARLLIADGLVRVAEVTPVVEEPRALRLGMPEPVSQLVGREPGWQLREAREAKGWSKERCVCRPGTAMPCGECRAAGFKMGGIPR